MNTSNQSLDNLVRKAFAVQFGQQSSDELYSQAMDLADYDRAEEFAQQAVKPWTRLTRLSFIRSRQGKLDEAIALVNAAENEIVTLVQRADHLGNLSHFSIMLGDLAEALDYGVQAVLLDPEVVGGAVNATCAASLMRSRKDLAKVLSLLATKAPGVLVHPHWRERWLNDPQLAFARYIVTTSATLH